jgi:hypothetical protein
MEAHWEGLPTAVRPSRRSMVAVARPGGARGGGAHERVSNSTDGGSESPSRWPSGVGSRSVEWQCRERWRGD